VSSSQCPENSREKEKNLYFASGFGWKTHQTAHHDPARVACGSERSGRATRALPAPISRGPTGARQDGPGAPQGLQPEGCFDLEQTCGQPGGIPLLVLPAQLGDRQKGEAVKATPQSVLMITSPTIARLQMLVRHRGTFQTQLRS